MEILKKIDRLINEVNDEDIKEDIKEVKFSIKKVSLVSKLRGLNSSSSSVKFEMG